MIQAKLNWRGGEEMATIRAASWDGVRRAVVFYFTQLQQALNVSNPRPYKTPSRPGEPPRKRTGFLQRAIAYELDEAKGEARVGVKANAKYAGFLELGTSRMAARPFLLATLEKFLPQIKALAQTGGGAAPAKGPP